MAVKPNFTRKKKRKVHGAAFWDKEYTNPEHLKLSEAESADLAKFTRWTERRKREDILATGSSAIDAGCGNGRNLIYLAREFGMNGIGVDISSAAVAQARRASEGLAIKYHVGSAGAPLPAEDESQTIALDMMTSHFLDKAGREHLRDELFRVLAPGGFLFMKTFLKDKDLHTARLLKDHPGQEEGTYIHPVMGVPEYVYSEEELVAFLSERFIVHKIYRSHKHTSKGKARKRRTISIYAEKDY
ncbi:MAG: methyltransferase domain-containing protein [Candidatus Kaiserbacteria bacterium]|nr:methyltransferase domain-containing protein [Candidatus Kaiserbacteria bacterium]MCB9815864.1 methyltransferase domain-containing protein [Candidatus Nomurabacteria bacterium]